MSASKGGIRQTIFTVTEDDAGRICKTLGLRTKRTPIDIEAREMIQLLARELARERALTRHLMNEQVIEHNMRGVLACVN
jgi:hypothetical protein